VVRLGHLPQVRVRAHRQCRQHHGHHGRLFEAQKARHHPLPAAHFRRPVPPRRSGLPVLPRRRSGKARVQARDRAGQRGPGGHDR